MDLGKLSTKEAADSGVWMHIRHPSTGDPLYADDDAKERPMRMRVLGEDSDRLRRIINRTGQEQMKKLIGRGGGAISDADADAQLDLAVAAVAAWENLVMLGEEFPYSPENARKILKDMPWLRDQVSDFLATRSNYLGN